MDDHTVGDQKGEFPSLKTERLLLRAFVLEDAPRVRLLAGEKEIASNTLAIPHPYEEGMAEAWIGTHQEGFDKGNLSTFAIVLRSSDELIGAIGLTVNQEHANAELGYWIGKPYWNHGYCTEAAEEVLRYGFEQLDLNRIYATHLRRNPASGRVMKKLGMMHEGCRRKHVLKWGVFEDLEMYGILKSEFTSLKARRRSNPQ
jgi:ribosomal-protein-alanine N-acetyltransferase